ncbi:hypothetical protein H6G80_31280 [Nostoc sp. FACHB-87]|uniref:hypothetical protein n=1 Tax=Nostocaceae TaxID=1162 RepID=UPI001686E462|nr:MULTISPECIES: hypothetical protein [Nostocaceae]MBD2458536.1 hypothetical protein [Nostoc sp. FACHB-87]MBD2479616.1 hypothetical protein [Anabaena sp. FACHB-83]
MNTEIKLGLGNPPLPIYLYVNKLEIDGQAYAWYNYDVSLDKKTPVAERALTGYLSELRLTGKDFKGKDNIKLDIVVFADDLYIVRSGIETNFTKSFLLAASLIEDFSRPLTIVATPGEENVVFCGLYDALTKTKIRRDWDANADWAGLLQQIQSRLFTRPKYDLDEDERDRSVVQQPAPTPTKPAAIHPQDLRVKQVRTLTNYPIDLIKEWLQFQDASAPSQLSVAVVDKLVRDICLSWAADKVDSNHATSSYQQQVLGAIASGTDEIQAIQAWMNYVVGQRATVSSR